MTTQYWHCGEAELESLTALDKLMNVRHEVQEFVNENVGLALKDYAAEISLQFGDTFGEVTDEFNPDIVYVLLCGEPDDDDGLIGKQFSLREEILEWLPAIEDCDWENLALHLEKIAAEIRLRASKAK